MQSRVELARSGAGEKRTFRFDVVFDKFTPVLVFRSAKRGKEAAVAAYAFSTSPAGPWSAQAIHHGAIAGCRAPSRVPEHTPVSTRPAARQGLPSRRFDP